MGTGTQRKAAPHFMNGAAFRHASPTPHSCLLASQLLTRVATPDALTTSDVLNRSEVPGRVRSHSPRAGHTPAGAGPRPDRCPASAELARLRLAPNPVWQPPWKTERGSGSSCRLSVPPDRRRDSPEPKENATTAQPPPPPAPCRLPSQKERRDASLPAAFLR